MTDAAYNPTDAEREREEREERAESERVDFYTTIADGDLFVHLEHGPGRPTVANVAAVMRHGSKPPTMTVPGWIVQQELHWVASEPEAGKTMLALRLAIAVMADGGRVAYFDEELGDEVIAERLTALGADPDVVERQFVYAPFPGWQTTDADEAAHADFLRALKPALVVYDTATDMLAEAGLEENSGVDVTRWVKSYPEQARRVGAAQLVLDHVGHGAKDRAVGSRAKRAKAKVGYTIELIKPFDAATVGHVHITRTKNTRGADIPVDRDYAIGGTPFMWEALPVTPGTLHGRTRGAAKMAAESRARERVLKVCPTSREAAITKTKLRELAGGNATVTGNAIDELTALEHIHSYDHPDTGRVVYWQGLPTDAELLAIAADLHV
jgi:hypothetical protein